MPKIYIENSSSEYRDLFKSMGFTLTFSVEEADLVCFTGGSDVSPSLYGDKQHVYTGISKERDAKEVNLFNTCQGLDKPMVGICRGGQFLNVMSGGRMYQHVESHTRSHHITDLHSGETLYVTSTHHQMMMPGPKALLVAVAALGGQREWYTGEVFHRDRSDMDYEVCYYRHTKSLCFQPHPEMGKESAEYIAMRRYFQSLLEHFFNI